MNDAVPARDSTGAESNTPSTPTQFVHLERRYRHLKSWLWGYDYFISYHWNSGGQYAVTLAQRLIDRGYDCFLDRSEYAMGDDWKREGERALRHTQRLVLIATREAITESKPVAREVEIFTSRSRHVIPIVFGETFTDADREHYPVLAKIPDSQLYIAESPDKRQIGPSDDVIEQLIRTDRVLRRRTLRTRIVTTVIGLLALALTTVAISFWRTNRALANEQRERRFATAREYVALSQFIKPEAPETSSLMALQAQKVFEGTAQHVPFYVNSALFASLEMLGGHGLGREDGTVQVARIDDGRLYTAGVVSNIFRVRDVSQGRFSTLLECELPPIVAPSLSFHPRRFSFSGDNRWVAVLGHSQQQELAFVDLTTHQAYPVAYHIPEKPSENSDLNPPSRPVFGGDSKSLFFVDRTCHLHSFRLKESKWQHERSMDLFPTREGNPQLRFVAHSVVDARYFAYVFSTDKYTEICAINLQAPTDPPHVLHRDEGIDSSMQLDNLADAGRTLYAWSTNGTVPFRAWRLSGGDDTALEQIPVRSRSEKVDRRLVRLIAISYSGGDVVCQSSSGDTFIHSIGRGFSGELPKFTHRAWFSADGHYLFTVEEESREIITSRVKMWALSDESELTAPKELLKYEGTIFDVISGDDGKQFVVNAHGEKSVSWLLTLDEERNVTQRVSIPFQARHYSSDLRLVSDGSRLWDRDWAASMQFPVTNQIDRDQGTAFYSLPDNRVLYIDKHSRCVVGELRGNGRTREVALLGENAVTASVNREGTHAVVVTDTTCQFWSLAGNKPTRLSQIPLSDTAQPICVQISDAGRLALLGLTSGGEEFAQYRVLVLDDQNPNKPIELETADELLSLRFAWVREHVALVSSARRPSADGSDSPSIDAEAIAESTRLYVIRGGNARQVQELKVGGQWVAPSGNGERICILSTQAEAIGSEQLGSVFRISTDGRLNSPVPVVKSRGQRRVEDVDLSFDGNWLAISGNSPALFVNSSRGYTPIFLEVDNDRIDECVFDPSSRWALSFSHTGWQSWATLWHLGGEQPNVEKIRVQRAEGHNVAGKQMNVQFGQRHISFTDGEAAIVIGDELLRFPLEFDDWTSTAFDMVGRNLSAKEIREHLGGRDIPPLHPDWERPLSIEAWEGTH